VATVRTPSRVVRTVLGHCLWPLQLGEPSAEQVGTRSDRGACPQRALIGESRRKDDRLDVQTLARLARIDPQLLCPVNPVHENHFTGSQPSGKPAVIVVTRPWLRCTDLPLEKLN